MQRQAAGDRKRHLCRFSFFVLLPLVFLIFGTIKTAATNVFFDLNAPLFNANPATNRIVTLQPLTPFAGNLIFFAADTNGQFTFSNAWVGDFAGQIKAPPGSINFQITVTSTNLGTVNADTITSQLGIQTYPTAGRSSWTIQTSDQRYQLAGNTLTNFFYPLFSNPSNYVQNATLIAASNSISASLGATNAALLVDLAAGTNAAVAGAQVTLNASNLLILGAATNIASAQGAANTNDTIARVLAQGTASTNDTIARIAVAGVASTNNSMVLSNNVYVAGTNAVSTKSAFNATNGMAISAGIAAFHPTNDFDLAGVGLAIGAAGTNNVMTASNAVYRAGTNAVSSQSAFNATNGMQSGAFTDTNLFKITVTNIANASSQAATNGMLATVTNIAQSVGGSAGNFIANASGKGTNTTLVGSPSIAVTNLSIPGNTGAINLIQADSGSGGFGALINLPQGWQIQGGASQSGSSFQASGMSIGSNSPAPYGEIGSVVIGTTNDIGGNLGSGNVSTYSTILGGTQNKTDVRVDFATIVGGQNNTVSASYAYALGVLANPQHKGSWVYSAFGQGLFSSTATNQFLIGVLGGGVGINTNTLNGRALSVSGNAGFSSATIEQSMNIGINPLMLVGTNTVGMTNNGNVAINGTSANGTYFYNGTYLTNQQGNGFAIGWSSPNFLFMSNGVTLQTATALNQPAWSVVSGAAGAAGTYIGSTWNMNGVVMNGYVSSTNLNYQITNANGVALASYVKTNESRSLNFTGSFAVTNDSQVRITGSGILIQDDDYFDGQNIFRIDPAVGIYMTEGSGGTLFQMTANGTAVLRGGGAAGSTVELSNGSAGVALYPSGIITNNGVVYGNFFGATNIQSTNIVGQIPVASLTNAGSLWTNFTVFQTTNNGAVYTNIFALKTSVTNLVQAATNGMLGTITNIVRSVPALTAIVATNAAPGNAGNIVSTNDTHPAISISGAMFIGSAIITNLNVVVTNYFTNAIGVLANLNVTNRINTKFLVVSNNADVRGILSANSLVVTNTLVVSNSSDFWPQMTIHDNGFGRTTLRLVADNFLVDDLPQDIFHNGLDDANPSFYGNDWMDQISFIANQANYDSLFNSGHFYAAGIPGIRINASSPYQGYGDGRLAVEVSSDYGTNGYLGTIWEFLPVKGQDAGFLPSGTFGHPERLSDWGVAIGANPESIHTLYSKSDANLQVVGIAGMPEMILEESDSDDPVNLVPIGSVYDGAGLFVCDSTVGISGIYGGLNYTWSDNGDANNTSYSLGNDGVTSTASSFVMLGGQFILHGVAGELVTAVVMLKRMNGELRNTGGLLYATENDTNGVILIGKNSPGDAQWLTNLPAAGISTNGSTAGQVLGSVGGIAVWTNVPAIDLPGIVAIPTNNAPYNVSTNATQLTMTNGNARGLFVVSLAFDDVTGGNPSCTVLATNLVSTNRFGTLSPQLSGLTLVGTVSTTNSYMWPAQTNSTLIIVDTSSGGAAVRKVTGQIFN